jgi:hypothetical protein
VLRFVHAVTSLLCLLLACGGESRHDLYMRGMAIEGEASRGACKLEFDAKERSHVIDGDVVQACLEQTEEAISVYEQAKARGMSDLDFQKTYERALERRERLRGMLKTLRELEAPSGAGPGISQ